MNVNVLLQFFCTCRQHFVLNFIHNFVFQILSYIMQSVLYIINSTICTSLQNLFFLNLIFLNNILLRNNENLLKINKN